MRVSNPGCSPARIQHRHVAPNPTGFAEIVSDYLPLIATTHTNQSGWCPCRFCSAASNRSRSSISHWRCSSVHTTWPCCAVAVIYARGFAAGGVRAGVGLGIMFGIIYTGANLISYGVQPFPGDLVAWYSIAGLIEYAIVGAIVGTIYKAGPAMPV